ncbi:uncharacterized protein LOC120500151 [Passer montanus]|uniref:uncharacterized protein LOC120500151 n=1 Tax=Passer montanus TaxID=9160 RepID=UPI0019617CC6|nr:uncharacterized protein LOC120500151 [Passer montanus]
MGLSVVFHVPRSLQVHGMGLSVLIPSLGSFQGQGMGCQWWFRGLGSFQVHGMGLSVLIPSLGSFQGQGMGCQWWFRGLGSFQVHGMGLSVLLHVPRSFQHGSALPAGHRSRWHCCSRDWGWDQDRDWGQDRARDWDWDQHCDRDQDRDWGQDRARDWDWDWHCDQDRGRAVRSAVSAAETEPEVEEQQALGMPSRVPAFSRHPPPGKAPLRAGLAARPCRCQRDTRPKAAPPLLVPGGSQPGWDRWVLALCKVTAEAPPPFPARGFLPRQGNRARIWGIRARPPRARLCREGSPGMGRGGWGRAAAAPSQSRPRPRGSLP